MNEALVDGAFVPVMTYDFLDFQPVAPAEAALALDEPWTHETCNRHARARASSVDCAQHHSRAQVGGFAYLHLFHYYLMV